MEGASEFNRWKTQQKKTGKLLVAYLVESRRENKKMRQVNLAYLGSIQEDFIPDGEQRLKFWKSVHQRAKRHRLELSPTMRAVLLSRVPKGAEDKDCWMTHEEDITRIRQF